MAAFNFSSGSFLSVIIESGWIAIGVLLVLLFMSMFSWGLILKKWIEYFFSMRSAKKFLSSINFDLGLTEIVYRTELQPKSYLAKTFHDAYAIFNSHFDRDDFELTDASKNRLINRIERNIEKSIVSQSGRMERGLSALASISSSAPFIGLFGTVIGIIDAFYSIGAKGSSNIAVVAPGISAALVATAVGLFTAIPALMAYNIFRDKTRTISNDMRQFGLELVDWLVEDIHDKTA